MPTSIHILPTALRGPAQRADPPIMWCVCIQIMIRLFPDSAPYLPLSEPVSIRGSLSTVHGFPCPHLPTSSQPPSDGRHCVPTLLSCGVPCGVLFPRRSRRQRCLQLFDTFTPWPASRFGVGCACHRYYLSIGSSRPSSSSASKASSNSGSYSASWSRRSTMAAAPGGMSLVSSSSLHGPVESRDAPAYGTRRGPGFSGSHSSLGWSHYCRRLVPPAVVLDPQHRPWVPRGL